MELAADVGPPRETSGKARAQNLADEPRVRSVFTFAAIALLFYFVQQYFWPAPMGVLVQGMIIGGLTALISFGIALVYRANRIINFAAGDLGAAPATLTVLLIVGPGFPYFLALPIGIAAAVVLGMIVNFVFIRRFFKAPRLILTVVTIFLSQILTGVALIMPLLFDQRTPPQSFPSPFDFTWTVHPIIFRGNDIIAMLAVPATIIFLTFFFKYTNIGIAVRASAESADRAALLGIPVKRIHTIVWVIATALAAMALFLRAGIIGLPIGQVLGPGILLRALAAAVVGRMEKFSVIFFAAVGLGIIEQAIVWDTGRAILSDPIIFVVVLGALLLQRRGVVSRAEDTQASTWQAAKEVRPVPRELAHLPEVKWVFRSLTLALAAFLVSLPMWLPESRVNLAAVVIIFGIIGISLVVLTGWAGQVSLGQMAFVGIGSAVAGNLTARNEWDISLAILGAAVVGAVVAVLIGLPALRIRGLFLAVTTLSFALATSSYLINDEFFSWVPTRTRILRTPLFGRIDISTEDRFYYLTLVGLALALGAVRGLRRSRTGRALIGVRENERGAQVFGVNAVRAKLTAFAVSGFLAAFAGGLYVHHQQSQLTNPFLPAESLRAFIMVVIGGLGSVSGALLGATYLFGVNYFARSQLIQFLASGLGAIFILLILPGGLGSLFYNLRDNYLRRVAKRRKIIVPSLLADSRTEATTMAAVEAAEHMGQTLPAQAGVAPENVPPADDLVPAGAPAAHEDFAPPGDGEIDLTGTQPTIKRERSR